MASKLASDPRIDPRIKALFGNMPPATASKNVSSREELLAEENSEEAHKRWAQMQAMFDMVDNEDVAPSKGLSIRTETFRSEPDGNTVKIQFIRPDNKEQLPCVYYIHGGGM